MCSLINAYACTSKHLYGISSSETWQKPNQGPFALFLEFTHLFVLFKYPTLLTSNLYFSNLDFKLFLEVVHVLAKIFKLLSSSQYDFMLGFSHLIT